MHKSYKTSYANRTHMAHTSIHVKNTSNTHHTNLIQISYKSYRNQTHIIQQPIQSFQKNHSNTKHHTHLAHIIHTSYRNRNTIVHTSYTHIQRTVDNRTQIRHASYTHIKLIIKSYKASFTSHRQITQHITRSYTH